MDILIESATARNIGVRNCGDALSDSPWPVPAHDSQEDKEDRTKD